MAFESSDVRKPRAYLVIGGASLLCLSAHATRSRTRKSDTFEAEISLSYAAQFGFDVSWWASQGAIEADSVWSDGNTTKTVISGRVDSVRIDLVERIVHVSGRDASSKLSEKRRSKKYNNQKASDIVSEIAGDYGLTPVIETSEDDAGKQYQQDTAHLVLNKTDFETLSDLAEREGAYWYVDGNELHFVPKESGGNVYPLIYRPPSAASYMAANFMRVRLSRNLRASQTAKVTVKSHHAKDDKDYEYTATSGGDGDGTLEYVHEIPMLNQKQVEKVAKSKLADVIRHELQVEVEEMPGDLSLEPEFKLSLSGTGSLFDQEYDIDHIQYQMRDGSNFTMSVHIKAPKKGRSAE